MTVRTHDHNVPPEIQKVKRFVKISQKICRRKMRETFAKMVAFLRATAYIMDMQNDAIAVARATILSIREPRQTALAAHLGVASCRIASWRRTLSLHDPRDLPIHADRIAKWAESHPQLNREIRA